MDFAIGLVIGFVVGLAAGFGLMLLDRRRSRDATAQMENAFRALAVSALDENAARLMEKVGSDLDSRKAMIDQTLQAMNDSLAEVRRQLDESEQKRNRDFGALGKSVSDLSATTGELHRILGSTQRRGMWGERMAEDILRLAGLVEGVNYHRQSGRDAESGRPDFTFVLPNDLKLNMDVKFPLGHYKAWLDAPDEERPSRLKELVTAVRGHVKAVSKRGYIDPKAPTVNFVLVFLPSEQLLSVALEADPDLVDEALDQKVVLASPLTLYAMLSMVRQAAENANVFRTAGEVIELLRQFRKQWDLYNAEMDKLGQRIESAARQFETVRSTRSNMLEKPLNRIADLGMGLNEGGDE